MEGSGGSNHGRSHRGDHEGSGSSSQSQTTRRGFRGTAENAKTKLCLRWQSPEGCRFGDRCNFAHGESELRKLPSRQQCKQVPVSGPGVQGQQQHQGGGVQAGAQHQQHQQQPPHPPPRPPAGPASSARPGTGVGGPVQVQGPGHMVHQAAGQGQGMGFADVAGRPPPVPPPQHHGGGVAVPVHPHQGGGQGAPMQMQQMGGGHPGAQAHAHGPGSAYSPFAPSSGYSGIGGGSWMNTMSWSQASQAQGGGGGAPGGVPQHHQGGQVPGPPPQPPMQPSAWASHPQQQQQQGVAPPAHVHHQHQQVHHQQVMMNNGMAKAQKPLPPGNWGVGAPTQPQAPPTSGGTNLWNFGAPEGSQAPAVALATSPNSGASIWQNVYNSKVPPGHAPVSQQMEEASGGGQRSMHQGQQVGGWAAPQSQGHQGGFGVQGQSQAQMARMAPLGSEAPGGMGMGMGMGAPPMAGGQWHGQGGPPPGQMKPGMHLRMGTHPGAWAPPPGRDGVAGGGQLQAQQQQQQQQQQVASPSPSTYAGAAASGLQSSQAAPAGAVEWKEYTLPETGEKYYHNMRTGKTQWERPNQVNLGVLKW